MNGVEILSSVQIASEFAFSWTWFWAGFGIMLGISLLLSIYYVVKECCDWPLIPICSAVGVIGGIILGIGIGHINATPIAYETHYKVTIDDSVSMNEFLDKYEIVDQEGKIYTVKEKTK